MPRLRRSTAAIFALCLVAAACADDDDAAPAESAPTSTTASEVETTTPVEPVLVTGVQVLPNEFMTVAANVTVSTDRDATVIVRASAGDHVVETPASPPGTEHSIDLLGLRPERDYALEIIASATDGGTGTAESAFSSGAIPAVFPSIAVTVNDSDRTAPGLTYFPITALGNGFDDAPSRPDVEIPERYGAIVAVDESGEIVWYREMRGPISGITRSANGTLWAVEAQLRLREVAPDGEILRTVEGRSSRNLRDADAPASDAVFVDTDTMHHTVVELDDGNVMTLSTELTSISGFSEDPCPDNGIDTTESLEIIADVVVIFDPDTGEIVDEWPLLDLVDPVAQPGAVICDVVPFPTWYPNSPDAGDWSHANAIEVDRANDLLLVSSRHLSSVLAIDFSDTEARGSLVWQLGPGLDFELGGPGAEWQYMQHAPEVLDDGGLIIYDNGNLRPGTTHHDDSGVDPYTRAVIFDLDYNAGVATQRWAYIPRDESGAPIYADFVGDADLLDNGNVLIGHGGIIVIEEVEIDGVVELFPEAHNYGRIIEVAPQGTDAGDVVFELVIRDQRSGWMSYAAERFDSLYDFS